jgi:hypothetical protein
LIVDSAYKLLPQYIRTINYQLSIINSLDIYVVRRYIAIPTEQEDQAGVGSKTY